MRLRPASTTDAYLLWIWANDPETRTGSGARPEIGWPDHRGWLERTLADPAAAILIGVTTDDQPIGTIRFESGDDWRSARLSYLVAPEARGRGFGRALLVEGVALLRKRNPRIRIEAEVVADNVRSQRLFESLGWEQAPAADGRLRYVDRREVPA